MYRIDPQNGDLIIDGFESGVSDSPYGTTLQTQVGNIQRTGMSDMRNVNIISIPGEASVGYATSSVQQTTITAAAYTVAASNDTFTYSGTALKNGTSVIFTISTGSAGISNATNYWVRDATATTFKVATGVDGAGIVTAAVDITSDGTGTFTTVDISAIVQIVPSDATVFNKNGISNIAPSSTLYGVDTNGRAWVFTSATPNWIYLGNLTITTTPPKPNGIAIWKSYILIFRSGDGKIDYRIISGASSTGAWTYGWKTINTGGTSFRTFTSKEGILYWGNQNNVGSLTELTTFDPANAATYTYTATALIIPVGDAVNCIDQLGSSLIIGGMSNVVYTWDRFSVNSSGVATYVPTLLPEATTARIIVVNSNAYIFAGNRGRIYQSNGANVQLYQKMPDHLSGTVEPYFVWGGAVYSRNQLYFSCSAISTADGTAIAQYGGIWAISTDTNALRLTNRLSYGTYGGMAIELAQNFSDTTVPGTSAGLGFSQVSLVSSWFDGSTTYGSDYVSTTPVPYTNYEAYIDSDMIPVGTFLNPNTDAQVEYKLAVPMVAGEGLKLAYRQDFSQSFTTITTTSRPTGEFTSADVLNGIAGIIPVNFQKSQWIQIRVSMKSTASSPSYVRLRELRIR